jgi:hypothetical protein
MSASGRVLLLLLQGVPSAASSFWSRPCFVAGAGLPGCWGGVRLGLGFVRRFGCFGFTGRRARWPGGLGGQEQDCPAHVLHALACDLLHQVRVH